MKRNVIAAVILSGIAAGLVYADPKPKGKSDCVIDDWQFEWKLAESGSRSALMIRKNAENTLVVLRAGIFVHKMLPSVAQDVGVALTKTDAIFNKMKGQKGASEKIDVGEMSVMFGTGDKGDFVVAISDGSKVGGNTTALDRKTAMLFAPLLADAVAKCKCVDERINP